MATDTSDGLSTAVPRTGLGVADVLATPRIAPPPATLEEARNQPGRRERIEELTRRIESEGIKYVFFQQVSITGRVMGKGVVASLLPAGRRAAATSSSTARPRTCSPTAHGNYIGFGPEESELAAVADLDTFEVLPWDPRVARVYCDCYDTETGELLDADPRQNLKRIAHEFEQELGLPVPDRHRARDDVAQASPRTGQAPEGVTKPYCYHIHQFEELRPVLHRRGRVRPGARPRHELRRPRGRARPARAQLPLRPARPDRRQHHDLPPGLRRGRRASTACCATLHAQAVHRRVGQRPPPPLHADRRRGQQRLPRPRRPGAALRDRAPLPRRHARPLPGADVRRQPDGELLLPHVGHRLLGPDLQELGLAEPHDDGARRVRRALRVPRRRLVLQPVPDGRGAAARGPRRHPPQDRPGRAAAGQHLRPARRRASRSRRCPTRSAPRSRRSPPTRSSASAMPGRLYKVFNHYKRDEWERYLAAVTDWERDEYLEVLP